MRTKRDNVYKINRQGGYCAVCGAYMQSPQFAHKIANRDDYRQKYGSVIIDDIDNGEMVCCNRCNDAVNIGNKPAEVYRLCIRIYTRKLIEMGLK